MISDAGWLLKPVPAPRIFSAYESNVSFDNMELVVNAQRDNLLIALWSRSVVVGEIRLSVSETIPAISNPAIFAGGAKPASTIFSVTSVEVLPTGSTENLIGALVGIFPNRW